MDSTFDIDANHNRNQIQGEIDHLNGSHWRTPLIDRDYGSFWNHVKSINEMFKELKPLRRNDRERLWSYFSSVCDETKRIQMEERQERGYKSKYLKNEIMSDIHSAEVQDLFGFDPPDVEEMKRLSQVLKSARETLSEKKYDMLSGDRQECYNFINEVQRSHDAWWDGLKRHRSEKREEFQQRLRSNLERNKEKLEKANNALSHCESRAEKLRDDISSAWNDEWASKAEGWLSELEDKINDIKESIERIERWIEEDEAKLD